MESSSYVGTWKLVAISDGFLKAAKINPWTYESSIEFRADGTFTALNFPSRDPYRTVNIEGNWTVMTGEYTPSGKTSILADGNHFIIQDGVGGIRLKNIISGMDEFSVTYKKE